MALDQAVLNGPMPNITELGLSERGSVWKWYLCGGNPQGVDPDLDLGPNYSTDEGACVSCPERNQIYCKKFWCKYFWGGWDHRWANRAYITLYGPNYAADEIICPGPEDAGCPTEWGYTYTQGKNRVWSKSTHDQVPPTFMKHSSKTGKVKITCNTTGESVYAYCRPRGVGERPAQFLFEWQSHNQRGPDVESPVPVTLPECPGPGEGWAEWTQWSGVNTDECIRSTATRTRQCLDGPHPGEPTPCVNQPPGPSQETKPYWPKSCGKCHADLGMMYTSGKLNKPKLVIPKFHKDDVETKFNDGFIKTRMPVVKAKCYDHEDFTRPYGQKCVCDDQGCRLGNAPLCYGENYNGYGFDYYWQPGAKDTFKDSGDNSVVVRSDYSIEYNDPATDERFENRVSWWNSHGEKGPSICRYWNGYAYVPGIERPIYGDDEDVARRYTTANPFSNWLECDTYVNNWPNRNAGLSNGAKFYEVLTSDQNLRWVQASELDDDEITSKMVVTGTYDKLTDGRKFHGLCRTTECTVDTNLGGPCQDKVVNTESKAMFEHMPSYPGLLYWTGEYWKCENLLVTSRIKEANDKSKFEILVRE